MRSLRRAGLIMITRADHVSRDIVENIRNRVQRFATAPIVVTRHQPLELVSTEGRTTSTNELHGKPVAAFAGIGNPAAFRKTLEDLGGLVKDFRVFLDHHAYTREDVEDLSRWAKQLPADAIIATTQKDFVKLRIADLAGRPFMGRPDGDEFHRRTGSLRSECYLPIVN